MAPGVAMAIMAGSAAEFNHLPVIELPRETAENQIICPRPPLQSSGRREHSPRGLRFAAENQRKGKKGILWKIHRRPQRLELVRP